MAALLRRARVNELAVHTGGLDLPLPVFLDAALRLPMLVRLLLLANDGLVALILRRVADVEAVATLGVRVDVVLLALVRSRDEPLIGQGLQVRALRWSVRGHLTKSR